MRGRLARRCGSGIMICPAGKNQISGFRASLSVTRSTRIADNQAGSPGASFLTVWHPLMSCIPPEIILWRAQQQVHAVAPGLAHA